MYLYTVEFMATRTYTNTLLHKQPEYNNTYTDKTVSEMHKHM